jgi:hypothetical protein
MKLFVSYARVDKPYCIQLVSVLDFHNVWFDQRLYAGQEWWKEILRRLEWCEGFVYLLSPESIASDYCRREFEIALSLGKYIFPVLVDRGLVLPDSLKDIQYVDLTTGLTGEAVKSLLGAIHVAEHQTWQRKSENPAQYPATALIDDGIHSMDETGSTLISRIARAMEDGLYDQAVFLLNQVRASGYKPRFINLDAMLAEAEAHWNNRRHAGKWNASTTRSLSYRN